MTRHRKHKQLLKELGSQNNMILNGNYLREKELIDKLSIKINEKRSIENINIAKINLPYPKIQVKSQNKKYAKILSTDFCGKISEFTAISQYINHELRLDNKYSNASKTLLSISKIEMIHMQIIGEIIILLGGSPNYCFYDYDSYNFWTPQYVEYGTNYVNMILLDINSEYKAIKQYEDHINAINDNYIKAILERIIKDEKYHIELLTELLDQDKTD